MSTVDRSKHEQSIHHAEQEKVSTPAGSGQQLAKQLALDSHGDPKKLAAILRPLHGAARDEVAGAAQKMFGNGVVHAAFTALSQHLAEPSGAPGAKFGSEDESGGGGAQHQRSDGVQGVGGGQTMFGAKDKDKAPATPLISAAQQGRYGDTFGASRFGNKQGPMDGGGANHKWGKGRTDKGFEDHSGDASSNPIGISNGDEAGTARGTASTSTMEPARGSEHVRQEGAGIGRPAATEAPGPKLVIPTDGSPIPYPTVPATTTPREDQESGGGPVILSRADAHHVEHGLGQQMAHGNAGASGDGRGDTGHVGPGTDGTMIASQRETVGGREPDVEKGGTVNLDAVLQINQLVNPART